MAVDLGYVCICNVPPQGLSGGLAILGKDPSDVRVLSHDARLIDCYINKNNQSFYLSLVYDHPSQSSQHHLWSKLANISLNGSDPWLMLDDFNEITSNNEKLAGHKETFMSSITFVR